MGWEGEWVSLSINKERRGKGREGRGKRARNVSSSTLDKTQHTKEEGRERSDRVGLDDCNKIKKYMYIIIYIIYIYQKKHTQKLARGDRTASSWQPGPLESRVVTMNNFKVYS